ncbi:hypothetical protein QCA50_019208 [Cerrena zonata]|uniref:Uncharacterized protein n=1 Tax=Cerrena zonata TaxID=2478898 RepID=A0AAW0FKA9_9APHY
MEDPERILESTDDNFVDQSNMIEFLTTGDLQNLGKLCEEFRIAKLELDKRHKDRTRRLQENQVANENPERQPDSSASVSTINLLSENSHPTSLDSIPNDADSSSNDSDISPIAFLFNGEFGSFDDKSLYPMGNSINEYLTSEDLLKLFAVYGNNELFDVQ